VRSSAPARHRKPPRRGHIALPSLAAAAILGIGGVGASAALSGGGGHPAALPPVAHPASSTPPATSSPTVGASTAPSVAAAPPSPATPPAPDFAITVTGRVCWIQVVGPHGRVLLAAIVRHGRTVSFPQRPLVVTLGDAGAVRLVLRHHAQVHAPGRPGQVLRFTVR
jgi:hypothetical protein